MEVENPSCLKEKELVLFPSSEVINNGEYTNFEHKIFNKSNDKTSSKRRLIITTISTDPILIEIRPNLPKPLINPLVSDSIQCDIIEKECYCNRTLCLEHMKLWNELNQLLYDSNACKCSEDYWFEKEIQDSFFDRTKRINCRELWPNICADALQTIKQLKGELEKEQDEREKYALALTKFGDIEEQLEMEKNMHSQEGKKYDEVILHLRSQVAKQAEEIRRLWTGNLAIESDCDLNIKSDENKQQQQQQQQHILKTKQHISKLECQLAEELKQYKITCTNQEAKCNYLQLKINELEMKQATLLFDKNECNNLKLKIEELQKENLQYQEEVMLSTFRKDGDDKILDYAKLQKEHDILKEELEKVNNNFNRTSNKLRHNVSKRRRLEAESEGEKQQRSNLAAALYELENEIEATISIINALQSTTCKSISLLTTDLENFQMELEKNADSNGSKLKSLICCNNDPAKPIDISEQSSNKNFEAMDSNMDNFKGIPNTKPIILKLAHGGKKLFNEISNVRVSMEEVLKSQKLQTCATRKEMVTKLETSEAEKETFCQKLKVLDEENKSLIEENSKLQHEVSTLKFAKSKYTMEIKDLDKEIEDLQEDAKNLREENRKIWKEAKWKLVGKQGGYQESLIIQEWEKKFKRLEVDYEILRHVKKDLMKDKHCLEDELNKATEKGYKGLVGSKDQKLENELYNMIQERNKLRKIKITLAIENVSFKESLAESRRKVDTLQIECESLQEWKEKAQKLDKECKELQNWKNKAEALEIQCKELHDNEMKVEVPNIECDCKKNSTLNKFEEEFKIINETIKDNRNDENSLEEECNKLRKYKLDLTIECQKLQEKVDNLDKECNILREFKKMIEKTNGYGECNANKLHAESYECENLSSDRDNLEVEKKNSTLNDLNSVVVENCKIQGYLETIANLKDENVKLCENHQAALDKQWNVLQVDLKAFEEKIEELESECESIRRDHLSSMVENSELAREKDKLLAMYNEQKYNYEILETAHECLQKNYEQKEAQQVKERNNYHVSIDNLNRQVLELESTFCERLHHQASNNNASCLQLKTIINGLDTITLKRQEYEILLAEKAIMLQERDNVHKKLCNVEVQNIQLSASLECLRQEISCNTQGHDKKEIDTEVLLAQDVVNLRSMLNSIEEELKNANCEKNKIVDVNMSLKKELNEVHEVLSHCEHENQSLNDRLEEYKKRSSLEQIHSAASSLKEQLGKVSKEKDSIKEQLNKVIKEKEQLANVANERDNVIFFLKDKIIKLEKEREVSYSSLKIQSQQKKDDTLVTSLEQDKFATIVMERDNSRKELAIVQGKLESLFSKMSDVENDQTQKLKFWQEKREKYKEKCKKIKIELHNTKEALEMTKIMMQRDIEEAIKEKNDFELMANKEIDNAHVHASQLHDKLVQIKQSSNEKINIASKDSNNIVMDKNKLINELMECKEKLSLMQIENEELTTLVREKDKVISSKYKSINEQDHLLAMVANLKLENDSSKKKFEQDLYEEMSSIKALLATTTKEKEELLIIVENSKQTINDLHVTMKSVDEQLVLLSFQKDELVQAKENVISERDELLEAISSSNKNKEIRHKNIESKSNCQSNGELEFCEIISNIHSIQNNSMEEDAKQIELNEMKTQYNILNDEKSILMQEKESFFEERNKLLEELSSLKRDNTIKLGKKGKRQWNFKGYKEEITVLLQEKEKLLTSESYLKQKIVDLEDKCTKNNSSLICEKMILLENHNNLVTEITLLKKEKEEIEIKLERHLAQHTVSMNDLQNALITNKENLLLKQKEHAKLMEDYSNLKEEMSILIQTKDIVSKEKNSFIVKIEHVEIENEELRNQLKDINNQLSSLRSKMCELSSERDQLIASNLCSTQELDTYKIKIVAQEELQGKLEGKFIEMNQAKETLIQENDKLLKQCKQQAQLQSEVFSLLKIKENFTKEYNILIKEMVVLKDEKESLDKKYITTLSEKDYILASQLSQQDEVKILSEKLFSLKEEVFDLNKKKNQLEVELQNIKMTKLVELKNQDKQTCTSTLFDTNEVAIFCNVIEDDKSIEYLKKKLELLKRQQDETIKERDNLALSLQERVQAHNNIISYQTEIETLKQKMYASNQQHVQLSQERDNILQENTTLQKNINDLQAKISTIKVEGEIMNSSTESEVTKHEVSKERFQKHQIASLQISVKTLKEQQIHLTKENMDTAFENEVLIKKRDCLLTSISSLKKQHENICVHELKKKDTIIVEASLKKKFEELVQIVDALSQSQESCAFQKESTTQVLETSQKECHPSFVEMVKLSNENQFLLYSSNKCHQIMDINLNNREEKINLQTSFKLKLNDLEKTTISIIENIIVSTKEKEKLILEISSLKKECQKLHMNLSSSERDKETLMKKILDSCSTFDCSVGEISRLQRELADIEMKLGHTIAEKENAKIQIANLQMHLDNQQRMQHLPISYSIEKVQSLEVQNRCLRIEKDVLEECFKKHSIEFNGSHLFKQHMPSMTNFNSTNQQPLSQHHLHTSTSYVSGSNTLGRPSTSILPMLHQQWPM